MSLLLHVAGESRSALLEEPRRGARHMALVIFLHGAGDSGAQVRDELHMAPAAFRADVMLAFPDGDPIHHSWRSGCCESYADSNKDFLFVNALINRLVSSGAVDPHRIVLGGFSAGALFANTYACRYPGRIRGVLAVAGALLVPPTFAAGAGVSGARCTPSRPVTVLEVHGLDDHEVPVSGDFARCRTQRCVPGAAGYVPSAREIDAWWRRLDGCGSPRPRVTSGVRVQLAVCRNGTLVGLALVLGIGHDLAALVKQFDVVGTLIALADGRRLPAW